MKSEADVDLAPEVERRDDAVKKKPILERTCKDILNITIDVCLTNDCASHTQCVGELLLWNVVSMRFKTNHLLRTPHGWTTKNHILINKIGISFKGKFALQY